MKWNLLACTAMLVAVLYTNTHAMPNLILEDGDLVERIDANIDALPKQYRNLGEGTTYIDPTQQEVTDFINTIFTHLYNSAFETAATNALVMDYQLVAFTDDVTDLVYYILERNPASMANNFWGTYVFNPNPDRGQLIIQAPHPLFDFRSGIQAAYVFRQVGAGFLFVSGTHRCSSPLASGCDGVSSVCTKTIQGFAAPQEFKDVDVGNTFRKADVAHNDNTMFQKLTEWIHNDNPSHYTFIQLHGFGQDLDPHVILSNGRDELTTPPNNDLLTVLRTQISNEWDNCAGSDISLIIEVAHDDDDKNFGSLLATTNTQGRFLNNSNDPCGQAANENTGRFVHIEQASKDGDFFLREEVNFQILGKAIINTYLEASLPVDLIFFDANEEDHIVTLEWETGWESGNNYFQVQRSLNGLDAFEAQGFVVGKGYSSINHFYQYKDNLPDHVQNQNVYYRLKQVDFNGTSDFSEVVRVYVSQSRNKQRLLGANSGVGTGVEVHLPPKFKSGSRISFQLMNLREGTYYTRLLRPEDVKAVLKQKLAESPPGVYQVILQYGGLQVSDKYLRL